MTDFSLAMSEWETFYLLAGTAAATLMGLLFVAVSINVEAFRREAYADLQQFAGLTFNCFFYVLFISIMFLIPNVSPFGLGVPLLLLGILGVANAIIQRRRAQQQQRDHGLKSIGRRFTLPTYVWRASDHLRPPDGPHHRRHLLSCRYHRDPVGHSRGQRLHSAHCGRCFGTGGGRERRGRRGRLVRGDDRIRATLWSESVHLLQQTLTSKRRYDLTIDGIVVGSETRAHSLRWFH